MKLYHQQEDCEARFENGILTMQNSKIQRQWETGEFGIRPIFLSHLQAEENWITKNDEEAILPIRQGSAGKLENILFSACSDDDLGFAKPHLCCELIFQYEACEVKYCFEIYPQTAVLRSRIFIRASDKQDLLPEVALDLLPLDGLHYEWEAVFLRAVTDSCNNLVQTKKGIVYPAETEKLSANILKVHRTLENDGLFWIKESPGGNEQTRYAGYDFIIEGSSCCAVSAGFEPSDISCNEFIPLYGCTIGFYSGGDYEFYRALREYHEARHIFRKGFDGSLLSNTWGDNNRSLKIQEEFLIRDIRAAHEIGITHYQVDAGWDDGCRVAGSWANRREINQKKLPHGFSKILELIQQQNMQLGLWLEPHSDDGHGYAYYQKDAQSMIDLYRNHGATFFKLDGFKLLSYTAAWHFEEMLRMVIRETDKKVYFNIDITNWPRTGFFCGTQYANFFLSNRYTDWKNYYPHYTQKNLWDLCRYLPSYRIQAECLNTERNNALYEERMPNDPLAPEKSGQAYALATVLMAAPLAWFEPCEMSEKNQREFSDLMLSVEKIRESMITSCVLPIGNCPNGTNFTGFQAITEPESGYLLFLKGKNTELSADYKLYPNTLYPGAKFELISSNCNQSVYVHSPDQVTVELGGEFSFALYRYQN